MLTLIEGLVKRLEADSGYIKRKSEEFSVFTSPIYLGNADSADNYEEITEDAYNAAKAEEDAKIRREAEEREREIQALAEANAPQAPVEG